MASRWNHGAVARVFEPGFAKMASDGLRLTACGEKCFVALASGDGDVPELKADYLATFLWTVNTNETSKIS
jgi:hypothetical protein